MPIWAHNLINLASLIFWTCTKIKRLNKKGIEINQPRILNLLVYFISTIFLIVSLLSVESL